MHRFAKPSISRHHSARAARVRLYVELLESRENPSTVIGIEPNDTLDASQVLGSLSIERLLEVNGVIGNGRNGAADVDWYSFTLERTATVKLTATGVDAADPVLAVYNSNPFDFGDPVTPLHNRRLGQSADGPTRLELVLGSGTYFAVLSGSGNRYFHPFLAGSGTAGEEGEYSLVLEATDRVQNSTDGPAVLSIDPAPGAELAAAPFAIRVTFDSPLDPGSISPDQTVRLIYNATGNFGDGTDEPVASMSYNLSTSGQELQLFPAVALKPGYYDVLVAGDNSLGGPVLTNLLGVPVGADDTHPGGQDYSFWFQVTGVEGLSAPGDDTPAFARELGTLIPDELVERVGAIGDDPFYDPLNPDAPTNPSADVDLYHFRIDGPGQFAFSAEVFAGRIGSALDPGLSLFRLDPASGELTFVAGNNDTRNAAHATNDTLPLYADPTLFEGLVAGDYYLAVTSNYNTPTTVEGGEPGTNGIFDPNVPHSGSAGFSTGPYVLRLAVHADTEAPTVVAATPSAGETLDAPPTAITVDFSEEVNLRKLFFLAFEKTTQETVSAVSLEAADGTRYFPRLQSYDAEANRATFLMLDGVPNGDYALHLSGALGLSDLAGNPLAGNDPSGDFLVRFTVAGAPRGENGNPLTYAVREPTDPSQPQDLGPIFPHEFQAGIALTRSADPTAIDSFDAFRFEVLQGKILGISLTGTDLPAGTQLDLTDGEGNPVIFGAGIDGRTLDAQLNPGIYILRVASWTLDRAATIAYEIRITLLGSSDNAPALTVGPAPAVQLRLVGTNPVSDFRLIEPLTTPTAIAPTPSAKALDPAGTTLVVSTISAPGPTGPTDSAAKPGVNLPGGFLAPLAVQPLGGVPFATREVGPEGANRVAIQLPTTTPAQLSSSSALLALATLTVDTSPEPEPRRTEAAPPPRVQPSAVDPVTPPTTDLVPVVSGTGQSESSTSPPETRPTGANPPMAVIPEEVCGVADVQPASDADHSTESVGIVEWVELTALTGVGAAVLVLQQRKRNLAPLRREAHTVV